MWGSFHTTLSRPAGGWPSDSGSAIPKPPSAHVIPSAHVRLKRSTSDAPSAASSYERTTRTGSDTA